MNIITSLSILFKYIAAITLFLIMLIISISVFMRAFNNPLLGDYIYVELGMIILVTTGISYTQQINGHVSIGLLVDRLTKSKQDFLDILAYFLTIFVSFITGFINFIIGIQRFEDQRMLKVVNIPVYPFIFIISIGFFVWGLVALTQLVLKVDHIRKELSDNDH